MGREGTRVPTHHASAPPRSRRTFSGSRRTLQSVAAVYDRRTFSGSRRTLQSVAAVYDRRAFLRGSRRTRPASEADTKLPDSPLKLKKIGSN